MKTATQLPPNLVSIGKAAARASVLARQIAEAAEALGITPAMRVDGVRYYAESDVDRIAERLKRAANCAGSAGESLKPRA